MAELDKTLEVRETPQWKNIAASWLPLAIYAILAFTGLLIALGVVMDYSAGIVSKALAFVSFGALLPAGAVFVWLLRNNREKPEMVFLLLAIPALLAFALFILPNHIPDEIWHIFRVFSVENPGNAMVAPAAFMPHLLPGNYAELRELFLSAASWSDTMQLERDMSAYLGHLYFVPGLVVKLCALFEVNPFVAIYCARLTNAALFAVAGYWIIKIMPMAKVVTCVYLLNPLLIQQEASCSADAVTNIVALLFVALLIHVRFKQEPTRRDAVVLAGLFLLTALSKYAYALLVFAFLVFVPLIEDRRKRVAVYSGVAVIVLLVAMYVMFFMRSEAYQDTLALIRSPFELVVVMKNTFIEMTPPWAEQLFGGALCNLDVLPWKPCIWVYALTLAFSLVFNLGERNELKRVEKIGMVVLVTFITAAIILVFRNWTLTVDLRSDVIMGFQGRYMLPYALLFLLCFSTPRASQVRQNCLVIYSAILLCIYAFDMIAFIGAFA